MDFINKMDNGTDIIGENGITAFPAVNASVSRSPARLTARQPGRSLMKLRPRWIPNFEHCGPGSVG
ncbi:hypothetical protein KCP76_19305 [Salmonella enterica subsp. enterica serovar Weltevreden]|nr:hypothetical protein KCP76_19305 [Salmonella enterica subsp. enterica serovar Weltevreden]